MKIFKFGLIISISCFLIFQILQIHLFYLPGHKEDLFPQYHLSFVEKDDKKKFINIHPKLVSPFDLNSIQRRMNILIANNKKNELDSMVEGIFSNYSYKICKSSCFNQMFVRRFDRVGDIKESYNFIDIDKVIYRYE